MPPVGAPASRHSERCSLPLGMNVWPQSLGSGRSTGAAGASGCYMTWSNCDGPGIGWKVGAFSASDWSTIRLVSPELSGAWGD